MVTETPDAAALSPALRVVENSEPHYTNGDEQSDLSWTLRPCHGSLNGTWKTRLEVQESHPCRPNSNTGHVRRHRTHLFHPDTSLLLAEVPLRCRSVFRRYSVYDFDPGNSSDEQNLRWPWVAVDRQRYMRVVWEYHHLWRFGW